MEIIIKDKNKFKGKNITELARNLESEGYPSEFLNEEVRSRVEFAERKARRPLNRKDAEKLQNEYLNRR